MTLVVFLLTLAYATLKMIDLVTRNGPNIVVNETSAFFEPETLVNVNEINFRFAFSLENFLDNKRRDDPRFVKWFVRLYGKKDSEWYERVLPFHRCTEQDYAEFNPVAK